MLEIIGQILCTLLLFKGIELIAQALSRQNDKDFGFVISFIAGLFCIFSAIYFFNIVGSQASGARKAFDAIQQQSDAVPEAVSPY